jgi:hypothetical protein
VVRAVGVACLVWLGVGASHAAPINYTEPAIGRGLVWLDPTGPNYSPPLSFTLDTGVNRFAGNVAGYEMEWYDERYPNGYFLPREDLFRVVVPAGLMITQVFVEAFNFNHSGATLDQKFRAQVGGFPGDSGSMGVLALPFGLQLISGNLVLYSSGSGLLPGPGVGPGTYTTYLGGLFRSTSRTVETDYRVSMTVAPVPEPATTALLGLAGLTRLARRRRA